MHAVDAAPALHVIRRTRRLLQRPLIWMACTGVLAAGVQVVGSPATAVAGEEAESPVSVAEAVAEAVSTGDRVEVTQERAETSTTWANPDGTVSLDLSTLPVRVEQDGQWVAPDYTLHAEGDRILPAASDVEVSFPNGGEGLADLSHDGQSFDVDWPGVLPVPTVQGATATYADVWPGIDLLMTAVPGGYAEVLRVDDARAAANPALNRLRFPTDVTAGSTVDDTAAGGLEVTDAEGEVAFQAPAPVMWDSSGGTTAGDNGLGDGDQVATMDLTTGNDQLVVTPSQRLLDDPATVYPVFIDPTPATPRNDWTMVQKEYPGTSFYRWDNNDGHGQSVGFQNADGVSTKRLIWEFDLGNVPNGADILDATMRATEVHSWSCTKADVDLDRVARIGPNTNWNNQPAQVNAGNLASSNIQVRQGNGEGGDCRKASTAIAFSTADLATAVHNSLDENAIALRLSAAEGGPIAWKRFLNGATLEVTYNRKPNEPTQIDMSGESGRTCGDWFPSGSAGALPSMTARFSDPDSGDTIDGFFIVDRQTDDGYVERADPGMYNQGNPQTMVHTVPVGAVQNASGTWLDGRYRFHAQGRDNRAGGTLGPASVNCYFSLDSHRPILADVTGAVTDPATGAVTPVDPEEWIPRGRNVTFSFDPTGSKGYDGVNDVDYYQVTSDVAALAKKVNPDALGAFGKLTFATSDVDLGEHWIRVTAYDRAGNPSTSSLTRLFRVQGAKQVARYRFDDTPGPLLPDEGVGPPLTLSAQGASFTVQHPATDGGPADKVLTLDGVRGTASAPRVGVSTLGAFSVSSWVRPTGPITAREVIASQRGGTSGSSFSLAIEPGCASNGGACLRFTVTDTDGTSRVVSSAREVKTGQWYLVAGSYDDQSSPQRLRAWVGQEQYLRDPGDTLLPLQVKETGAYLYAQTTSASPIDTQTSSTLLIGAEGTGTTYTPGHFWRGDLEDLRFYSDEASGRNLIDHVTTDNPYGP